MIEIAGRIISAGVQVLLELLCRSCGRRILQFFGVRRPSYVASFLIGFIVIWTVLVLACGLADHSAHYR